MSKSTVCSRQFSHQHQRLIYFFPPIALACCVQRIFIACHVEATYMARLSLQRLVKSLIITKGHVIDHRLLWRSKVLDLESQSIYSFWCEHNTSQFHTFGWIKLLTLGEIQHLSYEHLWSACDSWSIWSVTGRVTQDRKRQHICSSAC